MSGLYSMLRKTMYLGHVSILLLSSVVMTQPGLQLPFNPPISGDGPGNYLTDDETLISGDFSPDDFDITSNVIDRRPCRGINKSYAAFFCGSTVTTDTVTEVINITKNLLTKVHHLEAQDVTEIADIVEQVTMVNTISPQAGQNLLEMVSMVTQLNAAVLKQANTISGTSLNRIIQSVDELGQKVDLKDYSSVRLLSDTTVLDIWNLSKVADDVPVGLQLSVGDERSAQTSFLEDLISLSESKRPVYNKIDVAVTFAAPFIRTLVEDPDNRDREVRLWTSVFSDTGFFEHAVLSTSDADDEMPKRRTQTTNRTTRVNSKVISASISVDGVRVTDLDSHVVTTVFLPFVELPDDSRSQQSLCVFWDEYGAGGRGAWSQKGCHYSKTLEGRDVCVCDHLTNFAVLMDFYGESNQPSEPHQKALSVISIIGLSLSIAGLSCTVLSFICIKRLHKLRPRQVLFNLALAMLASWIVFLAGFTRGESHVGCLVVAALLHYFILASFLWMLVEAVLQYLLFVKVLGNAFRNFLLKTALIAWGLPVVPVVITLAVDPELYHGYDAYCWMSLTPFYFALLLPVGIVVLINLVIYVMVIVSICRLRGGKKKVSSTGTKNTGVRIRASIGCFVVLGLSWIFAFFAIADARLVFQYLFTITTSMQGFLVFLIFTARDPIVRAFWRDKFRRGVSCLTEVTRRTSTSPTTTTSSKTGTETDTQKTGQKSVITEKIAMQPISRSETDTRPAADPQSVRLEEVPVKSVSEDVNTDATGQQNSVNTTDAAVKSLSESDCGEQATQSKSVNTEITTEYSAGSGGKSVSPDEVAPECSAGPEDDIHEPGQKSVSTEKLTMHALDDPGTCDVQATEPNKVGNQETNMETFSGQEVDVETAKQKSVSAEAVVANLSSRVSDSDTAGTEQQSDSTKEKAVESCNEQEQETRQRSASTEEPVGDSCLGLKSGITGPEKNFLGTEDFAMNSIDLESDRNNPEQKALPSDELAVKSSDDLESDKQETEQKSADTVETTRL